MNILLDRAKKRDRKFAERVEESIRYHQLHLEVVRANPRAHRYWNETEYFKRELASLMRRRRKPPVPWELVAFIRGWLPKILKTLRLINQEAKASPTVRAVTRRFYPGEQLRDLTAAKWQRVIAETNHIAERKRLKAVARKLYPRKELGTLTTAQAQRAGREAKGESPLMDFPSIIWAQKTPEERWAAFIRFLSHLLGLPQPPQEKLPALIQTCQGDASPARASNDLLAGLLGRSSSQLQKAIAGRIRTSRT